MIKLGMKVRDTVSGFEGIVTAITEWLNGCVRVSVQPRVDKDGKMPDNVTFDVEQLVEIDVKICKKKIDVKLEKTGGDRPDVCRRDTVSRM